ncbi:MAG: CHAT domain-containing tetratricopeptide repeat protein [Actinomycetota bacterium]
MLARWLLGRAESELGDVVAACTTLAIARGEAIGLGRPDLAAEIGVSEAACLMVSGDLDNAIRELDRATESMPADRVGRLEMQRGLVELHRGDLEQALVLLDRAEPSLREQDDHAALARLLANRGVVHTQRRSPELARRDFETCRGLALEAGLDLIAAGAAHNLGYLHGETGAFPEALGWYEAAQREYQRLDQPQRAMAIIEYDTCTTYAAAGLFDEAIEAGVRAVAAADEAGDQVTLGDALLQLALAQVADRRNAEAADTARRATVVLDQSGRTPNAALAEFTEIRSGRTDAEPLRMRHLISVLDDHGWRQEADDIRLHVAEQLAAGDPQHPDVAELLARAASARRTGPAHRRMTGWYAEALRRFPHDLRAAERAAAVGVRIAEAHHATVASSDLRAHMSFRTQALLDLGLRIALVQGRPDAVLRWADRARAPSLGVRPVRPPADPEVAGLLDRLRSVRADGPVGADSEEEVAGLERQIRSAVRRSLDVEMEISKQLHGRDLETRLDGRALIEIVVAGDEVVSTVAHEGRVELVSRVPVDELTNSMTYAFAAWRRINRGSAGAPATEAVWSSLDTAAADLDQRLWGDLSVGDDTPVVVVADPSLDTIPWPALPRLRSRTWTLAPSAALWCAPETRPPITAESSVLLVAGPRLEAADLEIARIAESWPRSTQIDSTRSAANLVLDALSTCDVAHFAAHGTFRRDSPSFSSISLADGDLTVYDLETLAAVPRVVVLAACDLGRFAVRGSGDVLGTAAALLHLGVGTVIAPLTPVDDVAITPVMRRLHRHLAAGLDPATSLQKARVESSSDRTVAAAASSLVAISADHAVPGAA